MIEDRDIAKRFGKRKLMDMAEELDMEMKSSVRSITMVELLIKDIEDNGIPEEELSEYLFDFLIAAGFLDEDGTIIEDEEDEGGDEEQDEDDEDDEDEEELIKKHKCFGLSDDLAPECKVCPIFDRCETRHEEIRPKCYGKMYDDTVEACGVDCIDFRKCKELCADE